jgi:Fe2+ or Zn2+ uptake regulation protein
MRAEGRLTRYRKTVLQVLRSNHNHPTAAEVFRIVRRRRPGVAYATIYNALNWLERGGLIASTSPTKPHDTIPSLSATTTSYAPAAEA